jgi:spore coat assembly protein
MEFKIGDYVSRNSYGNDIVFEIVDIKNEFILKGVNMRLVATSPIEDLVLVNDFREDEFYSKVCNDEYFNGDRNDYFYLPAKVLQIDADASYLDKCLEFYKRNKIMAFGCVIKEEEMASNVCKYLEEYKPDILIITGPDALKKGDINDKDINSYKNTKYFINAVNEARKYEKSHERLLIIAGACQSNYEELIKAGADFASSPKRINIHALDPAIIATSIALLEKNKEVNLIELLSKTRYGSDGMGGLKVNGLMYVGYPR